METEKMNVEIWSDIMCPFCYIGKRHFESALQEFEGSSKIQITWKSFQLDPSIPEQLDEKVNVYQYLSDKKGFSYEHSVEMHDRVVQMAEQAGLEYDFDKAVVANSFKAHRLIQLAKTKGLGDAAEERLFLAYFTEGKDFGDPEVLTLLGNDIGLKATDVEEALSNNEYALKVNQDIREAQQVGVTGVPFFVFNRRYAVSGAQPAAAFLQTLQKSFGEWKQANPALQIQSSDGASCSPDGDCV